MRDTKRAPKPRTDGKTTRLMGWENALTGFGVEGKDKRLGSTFASNQMSQAMAEELWRGDPILARAVETIPNEMLREGYSISVEGDKKKSEQMDKEHRRVGVVEALREGCNYSRALGGAGLVPFPLDGARGTAMAEPLNEARVKAVEEVSVRSPRELIAEKFYSNPAKAKYGQVSHYRLVPMDYAPGNVVGEFPVIHESRIIRIDGVKTTRANRMRGMQPFWDDSIFIRIAQVVNDYAHAWQGAAILMTDFATPVLKIEGLAKILAARNADKNLVANRAAAVEMSRSIARVVIMDAKEEYKRETVSVAGLADLLDKLATHLAGTIGMPVSLLMGEAPAGLSATGDSDIRWFYDQVSALQERIVRPAIERLTRFMFLAKEGPFKGSDPEDWDVIFNPLWQLTDLEQATLRKTQAEADAVYINAQVVTPEEIAASRFGGEGYSTETVIDLELREKMKAEDDTHQETRLGVPDEHDVREREAQVAGAEKALEDPPEEKAPPFGKKKAK